MTDCLTSIPSDNQRELTNMRTVRDLNGWGRRSTSLGLVALCLTLLACGIQFRPRGTTYEITDYKLEIRSNTSWTASVDDNRAVDSEFNDPLDLPDEVQPVCAVVTKNTVEGYVRARVTPGGGWVETELPNGSVTPCSRL